MKVHKLMASDGQVIEIRELDDGRTACPVCGDAREGDWPWQLYRNVTPGVERAEASAAGSFDSCPCCHTEWGADDHVSSPDPDATKKRWAELRAAWLAKVGRTKAVVEQLRNLGIELAVDDKAGGDDPAPGNAASGS